MKTLIVSIALVTLASAASGAAFKQVSFATSDGGQIFANLYGEGSHAVVLAHGAVFNKESWHTQALQLKERGLKVLAIDFRGYGKSKAGKNGKTLSLDVLAAIDYLKGQGVEKVSLLGGSMGGRASAEASVASAPGDIYGFVLIANPPFGSPQKLKGDKLFIVSEGDGLAASVKSEFQKAPQPKHLEILEGSAHAQHIFKTDKAEKLTNLILDFLTKA